MKSRKYPENLDAKRFMREHWQREPLLVRGAFPRFADPLSPAEVLDLATDSEVSSRLVVRRASKWGVEHGPISAGRIKQLPRRDWTVLVQDTNLLSARADALLARFAFIPHARIDDVMVSYAVPGGGVGPHVDSYDVFLLQGRGRRRWRISRQRDQAFVPGLPLRILRDFRAEQEWTLEAGDMLYLPPGVAHEGVAETECLTWSIGFRAPTDAELVAGFLDHLRDRIAPEGQYGDAGARPAAQPGAVPAAMEAHARRVMAAVRWSQDDVREFTGRHLTEPKPSVYFSAPARPLTLAAFTRAAARGGLALVPASRLAFSGTMFFLNGETVAVAASARRAARHLANERCMRGPVDAPASFWEAAHAWYLSGFVVVEGKTK